MRLAVEIDVKQTGNGFEIVNAGLRTVDNNARSAARSTDDLGSMLAKAGVAAGLSILTKQAINLGDELATTAARTNSTVETLSALRLAAIQNGTSLEHVTSTMEGLQQQAVEAASGNRQLAQVFGIVGVKAKDLKTLAPEQLLEKVAKGFHGINDPAVRASISMQLMRDRAGELTPFLDELGKKGLAGVTEEAERMSAVMSTDAAQAANELNARIAVLRQQTSVALVGIAKSVNILADAFGDDLPKGLLASINPFNLLTEALRGVTALLVGGINTVKAFGAAFGAMAAGIADVYQILNKPDFSMSDWGKVKDRVKQIGSDVVDEVKDIGKRTQDQWDKIFTGTKFDFLGGHKPEPGKPALSGNDPRLRSIIGRADDSETKRLQAFQQLAQSIDQITLKQDKEIEKAKTLAQLAGLDIESARVRGDYDRIAENQLARHIDVMQSELAMSDKLLVIDRERVKLNEQIKRAEEDARHALANTQFDQLDRRIKFERAQFTQSNGKLGITEQEAKEEQAKIDEARLQELRLHKAKEHDIDVESTAARTKLEIDGARDANARILAISDERNKRLLGLYADINNAALGAIQTAAEDVFRGRGLKNAIDGFADALRSALAKALTSSLEEWLERVRRMAVSGSTDKTLLGGRASQQQLAGYGYAALQGASSVYGLYQNAQQGAGTGANAVAGAAQGAAIGSAAGPYGAAIGALLGAAYGAVLSKMAQGAQARFQVQVGQDGRLTVQGFGKAGAADVDAAVRALNATLDETIQSINSIIAAFPKAIARQIEEGSKDVFAPGDILSGDAVKRVRTFLISIRKKSFAGGFTADELKHFNEVELPEMVYDAYAPLFESGLRNLGVTEDKLKELFAKMPGFDPKEQLQRIQDFVTVLSGFIDSDAFNKLSGQDLMQKAITDVGKTPMDQILDFVSQIKELATGFADLTSDQQVERGKKILDLENQRQQAVLQYLYAIKQAQDAAFKSIEQQMFEIGLSGQGAFGQRSALQQRLAGVMGSIGSARTPEELSQIASDAQSLVGRIYDLSVQIPQDLKALIDGFGALGDVLKPEQSPAERLIELAGKMKDASDKLATASDPDAQVSAAKELLGLAQERYDLERQMLQEINAAIKQVNETLDQSIHDFNLEARITALGPNARPEDVANIRIEDLLGQQRSLRDQLNQATNAQDITRIVSEMNQNARDLFDLMGKTPEAAAQLTQMLTDVRQIANDKLKGLAEDIQKEDEAIKNEIRSAVTTLTTALALIPTAAKAAADELDRLRTALQTQFDVLRERVIQANTDLLQTVGDVLALLRSGLEGIFGPEPGAGNTGGGAGPGKNTPGAVGANSYNPPNGEGQQTVIMVNLGQPEINVQVSGTAERLIDSVTARAAMLGAQTAIIAVQQQQSVRAGL